MKSKEQVVPKITGKMTPKGADIVALIQALTGFLVQLVLMLVFLVFIFSDFPKKQDLLLFLSSNYGSSTMTAENITNAKPK